MRRFLAWVTILVATMGLAAGVRAPAGARQVAQGRSSNFELVGHNPLFGRGMNAALAIYLHFIYVGDRTDGGDLCVLSSGVPSRHGCPRSPAPDYPACIRSNVGALAISGGDGHRHWGARQVPALGDAGRWAGVTRARC
jgi:hypothetical protein